MRWKLPRYDGNSAVLCYSLQQKFIEEEAFHDIASNIDHEFYLVRDLKPTTSYAFRLASRNKIGWSEKAVESKVVTTLAEGAQKVRITKTMKHLQQLTESGQVINAEEHKNRCLYRLERDLIDWNTDPSYAENYNFVSEIARGQFSIVVKAIDRQQNAVVVAKIFDYNDNTSRSIQKEFENLRTLRHERIGALLAAIKPDEAQIAILVMERLQGANILQYLQIRVEYSEQMVATVVTQLLDALQYLHWRGICHLNIQPDNIVMASVRSVEIKLVDLGSAQAVSKLGTNVSVTGWLDFMAPEVLNEEPAYPQSDIWSVGVLTYLLMSGASPFRGADDDETKCNITYERYRFEHLYNNSTPELKRFIMAVFKRAPTKRPTVEECLENRWLQATEFMIRKREHAVFSTQTIKAFSEFYHELKAQEAAKVDDNISNMQTSPTPRQLTRSNSVQEELLTTF